MEPLLPEKPQHGSMHSGFASLDVFPGSPSTSVSVSGGRTRSVLESNLVRVTVCVCTVAVLVLTASVVSCVAGMHTELSLLRADLARLESCSRGAAEIDEEGPRTTLADSEDSQSSRRALDDVTAQRPDVTYFVLDEDGRSSLEPIISMATDGRPKSVVRSRSRRQAKDKPNQATKKPKQAAEKNKERKSQKASAVHFHPRNSTTRTITTRRESSVLDFWQPAKWSNMTGKPFYHLRDGTVTILEEGLYFIYAQLVFHDLSGRWSFSISVNDRQELKCINSEHIPAASTFHPTNHGVYQHCFSSSLFYIRRLEHVTLRCHYEQRNILMSPEFTFWGIIKMS